MDEPEFRYGVPNMIPVVRNFILSNAIVWFVVTVATACVIFIYPSQLYLPSQECTVREVGRSCYLDQGWDRVDCSYYGRPVECWAYNVSLYDDYYKTHLTASRFTAQFETAYNTNDLYFWGFVIMLVIFGLVTMFEVATICHYFNRPDKLIQDLTKPKESQPLLDPREDL